MLLRRSPLLGVMVQRDTWGLVGFLVAGVAVAFPGAVVLLPLAMASYALLLVAVEFQVPWGSIALTQLLLVVSLLPLLHAARALAGLDRRLGLLLLGLDLRSEAENVELSRARAGGAPVAAAPLARRVLGPLRSQRTWRDLLWVALRCVTSLALIAALWVLGQLLQLAGRSLEARDWWWAIPTLMIIAFLLLGVVHVLRAAGWVVAALAQALLVPSVDERVLTLRREVDTLHDRVELARELHDSLGHSVSLMVLQAAAARSRLGGRTLPTVHQACVDIERTGRNAMVELHRVLRLLRGREDDPAGRHLPAEPPGLEQVGEIVDALRRAGLPVHLEGDAADLPVSPVLSAALFRMVQESLTNVVVHVGLPATVVRVVRDAEQLTVVVENQAGQGGWEVTDPGTGLVELRARLQALGADLEAGPQGEGFRVTATVPAQAHT